jgi:hypothetical protein
MTLMKLDIEWDLSSTEAGASAPRPTSLSSSSDFLKQR